MVEFCIFVVFCCVRRRSTVTLFSRIDDELVLHVTVNYLNKV